MNRGLKITLIVVGSLVVAGGVTLGIVMRSKKKKKHAKQMKLVGKKLKNKITLKASAKDIHQITEYCMKQLKELLERNVANVSHGNH